MSFEVAASLHMGLRLGVHDLLNAFPPATCLSVYTSGVWLYEESVLRKKLVNKKPQGHQNCDGNGGLSGYWFMVRRDGVRSLDNMISLGSPLAIDKCTAVLYSLF